MKQWQEKIPSLNLLLISIILTIVFLMGFVIGPVNQTTLKNDKILEKLFSRYNIESCRELKDYYIDREMYVTRCIIADKEYYFFLDKNGIIYNQTPIDQNKEMLDFSMLMDKLNLKKSEFKVVYYRNQISYWIKSDEFEYVIGYENFDVLMKVRY